MFDVNILKDNAIIIAPNSRKEGILEKLNALDLNVKIISKDELIKNICFDYDDKTIIHLMNKNYSYHNAKEIIKNLYFIKDGNYKLNNLFCEKNELKAKNLIHINDKYIYLFKHRPVYIYGYSSLDKELELLLSRLEISPTFLSDEMNNFNQVAYSFKTIDEEVDYVFNEICLLVNQGISLNNIKLYSYGQDYELIVKKYASLYHLPINYQDSISLYKSSYFKLFYDRYLVSNLLEAYNYLVDFVKVDNYHFMTKLKNLIIDIEGLFSDREKEREYLLHKAKDIKLTNLEYVEGIDIVDYNHSQDDYIFMMGFNLTDFPKVTKDIDYLSDNEKEYLGINTSLINNKIEEENIIDFIKSHTNLYITFKKHIGKNEYYPSLLIEKLKMEVLSGESKLVRGSIESGRELVAKAKDIKYIFGIDSKEANLLSDQEAEYKVYDHQFKSFEKIRNFEKKYFSYSAINKFNKCPFSYYIDNVVKLGEFKDTFNMAQGRFYHKILEDFGDKEITKEEIIEKINESFPNAKDRFFVERELDIFYQAYQNNYNFYTSNENLKFYKEVEFQSKIDDKSYLFGIVDNLIIEENSKTLMILDYKTGGESFVKNKLNVGLSLQLPIYSMLVKDHYPEYTQMGLFIQNILMTKDNKEVAETRFKGMVMDNLDIIGIFEPYLIKETGSRKSKYFFGVSVKKDNSLQSSNSLICSDEWKKIIALSQEKVKEAIKGIREANFLISPIQIDEAGRSSPCSYCKHRSICFREDSDIRYIDLKEFEGDDENE